MPASRGHQTRRSPCTQVHVVDDEQIAVCRFSDVAEIVAIISFALEPWVRRRVLVMHEASEQVEGEQPGDREVRAVVRGVRVSDVGVGLCTAGRGGPYSPEVTVASDSRPTLDAMQMLSNEFHWLADAFLRYQYPALRSLRPHGVSDEGKPIAGTPDSYVGPSPGECTIAVEHTTYAMERLSGKFLEDYRKAAKNCPVAQSIYLCTNRPEVAGIADEVRTAALADARHLVIVWGDEIARTLDDQRQDLRKKHLGIPIGALTRDSLLPALADQLERVISVELFDPDARALEGRLQRRELEAGFRRLQPTRRPGLTWVIGDAGLGKTMWSAGLARDLASHTPVVWFPAASVGAEGVAAAIPLCQVA